jgi:hypothetical protein
MANTDLQQLIYVSHSHGQLDPPALDRILNAARSFNPTVGVTGLLLYHDGSFLQVLEGPQASIDMLMQKISQDRRHGGLLVMSSKPAASRVFPDWSMGYVPAGSLSGAQREGAFNLFAYAADRDVVPSGRAMLVDTHVASFLSTFREFEDASPAPPFADVASKIRL